MSEKKLNYINSKRSDPTSHFDKKIMLQIVKEVEDGLSRKKVCSKYGIAYATINRWMRSFASEEYRAALRRQFSSQQRRHIVRQILEEKITKQQARQLYKVSRKALDTWLFDAKKEDAELTSSNPDDMSIITSNHTQVDLLKQFNHAVLKIKALETMIDIAEQQFKIPIRKKPGAKQ